MPNHLFGADACAFEQVQHCAIKRIHPSPPRKSVLFGTDFLFQDNPLPFSSIFVALPRRKSLLSVHTRTKTPATIPQIVCLLPKRRCAFFVFQGCGLWLFFEKTAARFACRTTFSVLTLVLLNKFSTALLNESTPLHHENPCCLARIFFFKTILCLSAVFSWLYRAENLCYQFIHGQKLLPQFRRLSACYPSGDVLFSWLKRVNFGLRFVNDNRNTQNMAND